MKLQALRKRGLGLLGIASIAAASVVGLLASLGVPATASAAGCWGGPTVTDYWGDTYSTRTCPVYRSGTVWDDESHGQQASGYLYAGNNWFVCQRRSDLNNPPVGDARNNIWLYTQGDVGYFHRGWGWFPATYISYGENWEPIPGVPWCGAGKPY